MTLFGFGKERRAERRLRLAFPVLVEGPRGMRRCVARDVSARGLFVETPEVFSPGTTLRVTFALPDGSWEMTARCVVRHAVRLGAADGSLHGMGLSFDDVDDAAGASEGLEDPARREWA